VSIQVFGPLSMHWKNVVTCKFSLDDMITTMNFHAHQNAIKQTTIISAFWKTSIWPLDPSVIHDSKFMPALNTTTQAVPVGIILMRSKMKCLSVEPNVVGCSHTSRDLFVLSKGEISSRLYWHFNGVAEFKLPDDTTCINSAKQIQWLSAQAME
ncbi:hypothetical protein FOMPIDRAFT_1136952, partial [Fomitopsis schrenkii]